MHVLDIYLCISLSVFTMLVVLFIILFQLWYVRKILFYKENNTQWAYTVSMYYKPFCKHILMVFPIKRL